MVCLAWIWGVAFFVGGLVLLRKKYKGDTNINWQLVIGMFIISVVGAFLFHNWEYARIRTNVLDIDSARREVLEAQETTREIALSLIKINFLQLSTPDSPGAAKTEGYQTIAEELIRLIIKLKPEKEERNAFIQELRESMPEEMKQYWPDKEPSDR